MIKDVNQNADDGLQSAIPIVNSPRPVRSRSLLSVLQPYSANLSIRTCPEEESVVHTSNQR